jgi:hypothetical protein
MRAPVTASLSRLISLAVDHVDATYDPQRQQHQCDRQTHDDAS